MKVLILLLFLSIASCVTIQERPTIWDEDPTSYVEWKGMKLQFGLRNDGVVVWRYIE
jgi:hypothetical protein